MRRVPILGSEERMWSVSGAECCVLLDGSPPSEIEPASSIYRHKEGRCTCTGDRGSRRLLPESRGCSGRALWEVAVDYGAGRGSRPGHRPWSCGDRADILAVPAGGVVVAVGVPSSRGGVAAFRGSYRPGSCPGQGRSRFRGSCPCRSRAPRKGKYEGGTGSWQYSSWSSAEHVLYCVVGSHSIATAFGMAEQ